MSKRIVILGAGPTGLGAAYRLTEMGYRNWDIYEKEDQIGGLASSFKDQHGFTWDVGGHVIFSHYSYFDDLFEKLMQSQYSEHVRESWIWTLDRLIPYPFQNNIRHLPPDKIWECVLGLLNVKQNKPAPVNFSEWILGTFGQGIADCFLLPYNMKLWRYPLENMSRDWIEERVSVVDAERVLKNVILGEDDKGWGPNSKFRFPLHGGTGGFFSRFEPLIRGHLWMKKKAVEIDVMSKRIKFADGQDVAYDSLITTLPLDRLARILRPPREEPIRAGSDLKRCGVCVVGIGIKQSRTDSKCWVYFPEDKVPFYRVTYFSHYSPFNVPEEGYSSFLCETSFSDAKPDITTSIVEDTIQGLLRAQIISDRDREHITNQYLLRREYAYPIPSLSRDKALRTIQTYLMQNDIYSRGRFGAWKYEIGNMDHSVMMGVEAVNRILKDEEEKTWKI
jgi:protoporphyrinogen oxidase